MSEISKLVGENKYDECINLIEALQEKPDELQSLIVQLCEKHGLIASTLLTDIAYKKNTVFWWNHLAFAYWFALHYLDGAQHSALFFTLKQHQTDPQNLEVLEAILDYAGPPESILDISKGIDIAHLILKQDENHEKALRFLQTHKSF